MSDLSDKYSSVISAAQSAGCNVTTSEDGGRLNVNGTCPTQYAVNQVWDALKAIDPTMNAGDFSINLTADRQDIFGEYEVQSGDTLSAIAKNVTGGKLNYQQIFEANQDILSDPDSIQPGQKLKIPNFS
ncbi:MAG TPA: LysM peptidoglycan-binding domain-containing protein [Blastocatellia bacterium]|nr:LysM peptidoglycan-binding domain-containing protein [Blastocatellia bacterium]